MKNCEFTIECIVCDGLRGMFSLFADSPVQMCHFHQIAIVRRYLTKEPKILPSKELMAIVKTLTHSNKEAFIDTFLDWGKMDVFLKRAFLQQKNSKG